MKNTLTLITLLLLAPLAAVHAADAPKGEPTNAKESARKAAADAELDAKYQAWVAKLPPEQQAWERVLQENLGSFYLPINRIPTDDLFTAITPRLADLQNPNDVHFNSNGYEFLGRQVAAAVEAALQTRKDKTAP